MARTQLQQYLTNPKKLQHIALAVDGALSQAENEKTINSLEGFADFLKSYSETHSSYPVEMEVANVQDEVKGFRFYFSNNPSEWTSGFYLAKRLEVENIYTPSHFCKRLGIELPQTSENKFKNDFESDLDFIDPPSRSPQTQTTQEQAPANSRTDLEDWDDWSSISLPTGQQNTPSLAAQPKILKSQEARSKPQSKFQQPVIDGTDNTDDIEWSDLEDNKTSTIDNPSSVETNEVPDSENSDNLKSVSGNNSTDISPQSPTTRGSNPSNSDQNLLASIEAISQSLTNAGGPEVNGLNLMGPILAAMVAVYERSQKLNQRFEDLNDQTDLTEQLQQTEAIAKAINAADERIDDLTHRTQQLPSSQARSLPEQNNNTGEQPNQQNRVRDKLPNPINTEAAKTNNSHNQTDASQGESSELTDKLGTAATHLADNVNSLGKKLNEKTEEIPPLVFAPTESIEQRLDRIEQYLQQLNKRLDALEMKVEALEVQAGIRQSQSTEFEQPTFDYASASPKGVKGQEESWSNQASNLTSDETATKLFNYTTAVNEVNGEQPHQSGKFRLTPDRTIDIDHDRHQTQVAIINEEGNPIYLAVSEGDRWSTQKNDLTEDDQHLIHHLPQTCESYEQRQSAQKLITRLEKQHPTAFCDRDGGSFIHATVSQQGFTNLEFEVTKWQGQKVLEGYQLGENSDKKHVLSAIQQDKKWQVHHCDIPCEVLNADLEDKQGDRSISTNQPSSQQQQKLAVRDQQRQQKELEL